MNSKISVVILINQFFIPDTNFDNLAIFDKLM